MVPNTAMAEFALEQMWWDDSDSLFLRIEVSVEKEPQDGEQEVFVDGPVTDVCCLLFVVEKELEWLMSLMFDYSRTCQDEFVGLIWRPLAL